MIQALRFIDRKGRKILQQATDVFVRDGEFEYQWADVPLEEIGDAFDSGELEGDSTEEHQDGNRARKKA